MRVYHPKNLHSWFLYYIHIYIVSPDELNFARYRSVRSFIFYCIQKAKYVKRETIFLHIPGCFFRKGCLCFCIVVGCLVIEQ